MESYAQRVLVGAFGAGIVLFATISQASAAPWSETGDAQLRSDLELLAAAGVIDNVTTQWPIPWGGAFYTV